MDNKLVSIIMNCFNGEMYLCEAIDSVIKQNYQMWEIIFIDNCSTDNSARIVKGYNSPRIKYYKTEKNVLLGKARNIGISKSTGEYVTFLDVDDIWDNNFLSIGIDRLQDTSCGLFYSNYWKFNHNGQWLNDDKIAHEQIQYFKTLLQNYVVPMSGAIVKKQLLVSANIYFSNNFSLIEDYDFFLRIAYYTNVYYVAQPLVFYRMHASSQTFKLKKEWGDELRELIRLLHREILSPTEINLFKVEIEWLYVRSIYADVCYLLQKGSRYQALILIIKNASLSVKLLYPLLGVVFGYNCFQKIDNKFRRNKYRVI